MSLISHSAVLASGSEGMSERRERAARGHCGTAVAAAAILATTVGLGVLAGVPVSAAVLSAGTVWHSREILPPLNAAASPVASLDTVACAGGRSCSGGGSYESTSHAIEPMVVTESAGTWTRARELSLPPDAFSANPDSSVSSVACPAATSCVAVGGYTYDSAGHQHGFIAAQSGGRWARAQEVALPVNAAARGSNATLDAVTCTGAGSCLAVGGYLDNAGDVELMAVAESNGQWGRAREIAPPPNAAPNPSAVLDGVACWRTGGCAAVGLYRDARNHGQALAVTEAGGNWGRATEIAVPSNAGADPGAKLAGVSCGSPGACSAVGVYFDPSAAAHAMAVTKSSQGWARATEIRAPPAKGFEAPGLNGVSCTAAGSCEAVGSYLLNVAAVPMAVTQSAGRWQPAANVPPPANALMGMFADATLLSVACIKRSTCTAPGWYVDKSHHQQAMVATRPTP